MKKTVALTPREALKQDIQNNNALLRAFNNPNLRELIAANQKLLTALQARSTAPMAYPDKTDSDMDFEKFCDEVADLSINSEAKCTDYVNKLIHSETGKEAFDKLLAIQSNDRMDLLLAI